MEALLAFKSISPHLSAIASDGLQPVQNWKYTNCLCSSVPQFNLDMSSKSILSLLLSVLGLLSEMP